MKKSSLIDATRQYNSLTDNGAVTHSTSLNYCVDMFFLAGASRNMDEDDIITLFIRARSENKALAYRILFWARDCRGGAGEKRFFRIIASYLKSNHFEEWEVISIHMPEYGSWKDIFIIDDVNDDTLNYLSIQLEESKNANLLAKYFPRKGKWFVGMHKYLNKTPKEFRKYLVEKSNTVEQKMCAKEFSSIEYSKVPSIAMNNYRNVFMRRDNIRYSEYINDVLEGKAKVNASVLHPHQLVQAINGGQDSNAVQAQWNALPNYMEGSTERILPVCDVSGSMTGLPMDVSIALGLYISERNEGIFKDAFMTFSGTPTMEYVQGDTLKERIYSVGRAHWGNNTNLIATFKLLLDSATRENISQDEMPTKLLIISDMEFDVATSGRYSITNLDVVRELYENAGYKLPEIIFWNVNGRVGNVPARHNDPGIGLVSGFSPSILKTILKGEVLSPLQLVLDAVNVERYDPISRSLSNIA